MREGCWLIMAGYAELPADFLLPFVFRLFVC